MKEGAGLAKEFTLGDCRLVLSASEQPVGEVPNRRLGLGPCAQLNVDVPAGVPFAEEQGRALLIDVGPVTRDRSFASVQGRTSARASAGWPAGRARCRSPPGTRPPAGGLPPEGAVFLREPFLDIIGDLSIVEAADAVPRELPVIEPSLLVVRLAGT